MQFQVMRAFVLAAVMGAAFAQPPFDCSSFGCTCQGFMDYYGAKYGKGYGCAVGASVKWYDQQNCRFQCLANYTACAPKAHQHPGCGIDCSIFGCTCQGFVDFYGGSRNGTLSYGCATAQAEQWHKAEDCDLQCKIRGTGCTSSNAKHAGCKFDCTPFGCTCQGFADWYGTTSGRWHCATDPDVQEWWSAYRCGGKGVPKISPSVVPGSRRGGCSCIDETKDTTAGLHHKVPCGSLWMGFSVTYNVPQKCLSSSCGIIVDVHGFTMDGDAQDANTNMRALGEERGYIVIQPNAPLNNWNADAHGAPCTGLALPNATPGKQTCFLPPFDKEPIGDRAINNWLQEALDVKAWNVDKQRVHLTGFSEGGWVTGRMLCNYPRVFKSFVMLSGASNADPFECIQAGAPQPPVLINQGFNDLSSLWRTFDDGLQKLKAKWSLSEGKVIDGNATCGPEWEEFDCRRFGCTCQGFANWYGVTYSMFHAHKGCASDTAWKWYSGQKCMSYAEQRAYHGGCNGCFQRNRYQGPTGIPLEVLSYSYEGDYLLKGHCFPGSENTGHNGTEAFAFACPGARERNEGAKAGYVIGAETMKWFLAHEDSPTFVV